MAEDRAEGVTLAARSAGADRLVGVWLVLAAGLLGAGLFLPAVTVRRFFLAKQYSLAGGVFAFLEGGDWFLFAVTFAFTILFPVAKVAVCLALWFVVRGASPQAARLAQLLAALSKWSMLDVFIIALVVLVVDGRLLSSADVHAGVIAFTGAVLLSTYAVRRITVLLAKGADGQFAVK
jgi:paraquat-inducible protein A